jgi:hypothetical protein
MIITLRNQVLKTLSLLVYLVLLVLHLSVPINLTAVDIGRHIKNGELILSGNSAVLSKNFYSFTYPDYPFINHHWFFGVISYVIFRMSGFEGLSVFYIVLLVLTFLLAFDSARWYSNFNSGLFFSVAGFLLLVSRAEIRPEGLSVFFVALDFWLLQRFLQRRISGALLLIGIPIVQILWVNTHIFFPMGPLLVGLFLWQAKLAGDGRERLGILLRVFVLSVFVNLINPSGVWGMLTPLNVFKKFGYALAENQSAFFMIHRYGDNIIYKYYVAVAVMMIVGMVLCLRRERIKALPMVVLGAFITIAAFRAVRFFMPFGFLFIPLAAYYYSPYVKKTAVGFVLGFMSVASIILCVWRLPAYPQIGLMPQVNASAEFFKQNGLKGPIFSNYDIGGYLIYHLEGQEKVFVDNRQEAFPPDFFQKVYIPMQEDEAVWSQAQAKYGFNVIYFYRHDLTPWGQGFLIARVRDSQWAPVFVDDYTIIFTRRGSIDQGIVDRFEKPKSMFGVESNNPQ